MASIPVTEQSLAVLKHTLRQELPEVRSSHLSESIAAALGFRTYASLLVELPRHEADPEIHLLDEARFFSRLQDLGYGLDDDEFLFDGLACSTLIQTRPASSFEIEYNGKRAKAWRNLMVLTVNEGIRRKLFSLRPGDNRWDGALPEAEGHRGAGAVFDFSLPSGTPVKGYVSDAGFHELTIHAAVNPIGDWVRASNAGFNAGDAFASGWLERERGAWLQSSPDMFKCRNWLLQELAALGAAPLGYGDMGRGIM